MIFRRLTIRSKLLLAALATVLILVALALFFADAMQRKRQQQALLDQQRAWQSELNELRNCVHNVLMDDRTGLVAECLRTARSCETQLERIVSGFPAESGQEIQEMAQEVSASLDRLSNQLRSAAGTGNNNPPSLRTAAIELDDLAGEFDESVAVLQESYRKDLFLQQILVFFIGILLILTYMVVFSTYINRSFRKLLRFTERLSTGRLPEPLIHTSGDEFGKLAGHLNRHIDSLREKIAHITTFARDKPGAIYTPGEGDELGEALVELSNHLTHKELDEVTRNREDKKQNWISEGTAQLGEILRSERENVGELSFRIIQKLVSYMDVEMGALFIADDPAGDRPSLYLAASYAYDRRKFIKQTLEWGEGLPGTCAQEKERIFMTEVPDEYFDVASGTGHARPNCILLVPLKIGQLVYGVIELATVRLLRPFEIDFAESLSESIASSIEAVQTSERTAELLKQSQAQAETLKQQEGTLLENMKKLEQAQEESLKKETEINGILSAINQSSPVAEFGLNGRISEINEQFLMLLETHRDQVVGKKHSEFAQVDPYSDAYREFWAKLRKGTSMSAVEMYKLYSGKEIWLQQTFTPIRNSEGNVYKILNIAADITENQKLKEQLKTQELEIKRSHLDMQTLNEAVNSSLIKCELDPEGIIMDVNENYTQVTGFGRKELLGRNYRLFLKDTEKDQFEKIWNEVTKEKVYEGVIRRSQPTGEEVWLASTFSPVKDEAGKIYKVYFMGLDITEKKLKYQLLEDANREIERLKERMKDENV